MESKTKHFLLGIACLALLLSTAMLPMRINEIFDTKNLSFGYPIPFVSQDFSDNTKSYLGYPWYQRFELKRPISHFSLSRFVVSFLVFFVGIEVLVLVLELGKIKVVSFMEGGGGGKGLGSND
jgi:hypothetical protein